MATILPFAGMLRFSRRRPRALAPLPAFRVRASIPYRSAGDLGRWLHRRRAVCLNRVDLGANAEFWGDEGLVSGIKGSVRRSIRGL